jgi:hypothetical protein
VGLFNRYGTRFEERRRAKREVLLISLFIAFIILFLGGMWLLSSMGPRMDDERMESPREDFNASEVAERRTEVTKLQVQFDLVTADGDISEEDLEVLNQAIRKQRELVKMMGYPEPQDQDLLLELEARYATEAGSVLHEASIEAEKDAEQAAREGRSDDALAAINRAIALQDQINLMHALGDHRDVPRLRRLQIQKSNLVAEPMAKRAEELTQEARMVMTENPLQAEALLREALNLHDTLIREHRTSRFTNLSAHRAVQDLLIDVEAASLFGKREDLRARAAELLEANNFSEAAALIEQAIQVQRDLVLRFPESSYAAANEVQALEAERQSALSKGIARSIGEESAALRRLLKTRQVAAAGERVTELFRLVRQLHERFPSSRFLDEELFLESRFLNLKREDLGTVQDAVYERLRPIPGVAGSRMLSVEVPQLLFSLVMGTNPSSQEGDLLPVDSVDYATAQEFCERLSWILARPVRLPKRSEYEAALGEVRSTQLAGQVWSSQNSNRRTQQVGTAEANAQGFYDLLGNVSEWIDEKRPGDERQGLVIGGSVRQSVQDIGRVPSAFVSRNERSRFTGFRFVVDFDDAP